MMRRRSQPKEEEEKKKVTKESFKEALKIFSYIDPYKWYLIASLFLVVISTVIFFSLFKLLGLVIDVGQGQSDYNISLKQVGVIMIIILVVQGAISYFRVILTAIASEKGIADLRTDVYQKLISLPITFFEENRTGDLISRISADASKLFSIFSITLIEFFRQIITLIVGIIFLFISAPRLSVIMLLTFPFVILLAMFFGRKIRKLSKDRQARLADSNSQLGETIQNVQVVKSFASESYENEKYRTTLADVVRIAIKYASARAWFSFFIMTIFFGAICFIIYMGARMLQTGDMTAGELLSFVSYTGLIGGSIAGLGNFTTEIFGAIGATERIRNILSLNTELELTDKNKDIPLSLDGEIIFKDINFTYPARPDIQILKNLNIHIKKGQKVALVGPSGAGKSTIFQLLLRFYPITEGIVKVDNQAIADYDIRAFRSAISLVPQEVILFSGTIKENIKYADQNATDEMIINAAKQSNALEFIESFPEGLDTIIGERGVKLSGGQRQRIAIARAILKDPPILLLDEATSALDSESEKVVQDALDKLMIGRTSIIIAHRLSTIVDVDKIYVLQNGEVKEQGTHTDLMKIENGIYHRQASLGRLFQETEIS
ncbi:ABC transporter transmembrane domain-containing protein [Saprospiraceae bacterium]|nr:ABC transporter transmembrane domain-containing protein [Saprospiraceae bacterium]